MNRGVGRGVHGASSAWGAEGKVGRKRKVREDPVQEQGEKRETERQTLTRSKRELEIERKR